MIEHKLQSHLNIIYPYLILQTISCLQIASIFIIANMISEGLFDLNLDAFQMYV